MKQLSKVLVVLALLLVALMAFTSLAYADPPPPGCGGLFFSEYVEGSSYNKAVEMLGTENDNCIVIENAKLGVSSAKNAGIFSIGIPTYIDRKELEHADIVLRDHGELFRFLGLLIRT